MFFNVLICLLLDILNICKPAGKRSCENVMFSVLPVSHSVHKGGGEAPPILLEYFLV